MEHKKKEKDSDVVIHHTKFRIDLNGNGKSKNILSSYTSI
jgi:hypothetical protein